MGRSNIRALVMVLLIVVLVPIVGQAKELNITTPSASPFPLFSFSATNSYEYGKKTIRVLDRTCHERCVDDCDVRFKCEPFKVYRHCVEICEQVCSYYKTIGRPYNVVNEDHDCTRSCMKSMKNNFGNGGYMKDVVEACSSYCKNN